MVPHIRCIYAFTEGAVTLGGAVVNSGIIYRPLQMILKELYSHVFCIYSVFHDRRLEKGLAFREYNEASARIQQAGGKVLVSMRIEL